MSANIQTIKHPPMHIIVITALMSIGLSSACTDATGAPLDIPVSRQSDAIGVSNVNSNNRSLRGSGRRGSSEMRRGEGKGMGRRQGVGRTSNRGMGRRGRMHKHGPSMQLLRSALELTTIDETQRATIETLINSRQNTTRPRMKGFNSTFQSKLAETIRSGQIDPVLLSEHQTERDEAREAHVRQQTDIMNTLHKTLTSEQRSALVSNVKINLEARFLDNTYTGRGKHRRGTADGQGRRGRGFGKGRGGNGYKMGNRQGRGRGIGMMHMLDNLNLTSEQQTAVNALFDGQASKRPSDLDRETKRAEMITCHSAFLDAFATDSFDASSARCPRMTDDDRMDRRSRRLEGLTQLVEILDDNQRAILADRIENGPAF